ncbi:MAG: PEGA domain-containing protein, partial [Deltaproteobacteria bacterium]|nr:PEGA domain-containing protein [Deltaproteobacteria bacterium]
FGIVQASSVIETTTKGTLKGKIEYMSPEQALGEVLDRRSDVFALGIVMWEMLTGRRAFKTDNEIKTLERVRNVEIEPPALVNNQVPTRLSEIVMRCLEKDPADRYQDARELHADLLNFLYPATPDVVQQSLHHFMSELFADDIATERGRVEESTRLARAMHEAEPSVELQEDWEEGQRGGSEPTVAPVKAPPAPSKLPILLGAAALAVAVGVVGLGGLWMVNQDVPAPEVKTEIVKASPSIVLRVAPVEGVVKLDGKEVGKGTALTLPDVPLGKHKVEVSAEGYEPYAEEIDVGEGEKVRLDVKLVAVRKQPEVRVESPPRGAQPEVRIEPRVARQPEAKVDTPPPPPAEKAKGKVNINVSGGWADIYVDGKKIGTTPIFGHQLPVGTYAVRAKNEQTGLDATKQVTVKAGESASVAFSAQ